MDGDAQRPCEPGQRANQVQLGSRGNALTHGLSSRTLLADVIGPARIAAYRDRLTAEWQPRTTAEQVLVAELARHSAAMDFCEQAEQAVLREGAKAITKMMLPGDGPELRDSELAAAISTRSVDCVTRYRRAHERAFHAALRRLRDIQGDRQRQRASELARSFSTEAQCEEYLCGWLTRQGPRCCGEGEGYWLSGRTCWECAACGRQLGPRAGTIMARSPLPLVKWFSAIREMLIEPDLPVAELARRVGIGRRETARSVVERIRRALASDRQSELLAGLDQYFLASLNEASEIP